MFFAEGLASSNNSINWIFGLLLSKMLPNTSWFWLFSAKSNVSISLFGSSEFKRLKIYPDFDL